MWLSYFFLIILPLEVFSSIRDPEITCVNNSYPPTGQEQVPVYIIDLDLPPAERWVKLAKDKKEELTTLIQSIKNLISAFTGDSVIRVLDQLLPHLLNTLPDPYKSEIESLANTTGIPVGEITLYNVFYELFTVCTSLLAKNHADQDIVHGRNLDFGLFLGWDSQNHTWAVTEALRPTVVQLDFHKNNRSIFQAAGFAGYVGILTGLRNGLFSLTIDERFNLNGGFRGLIDWIMGQRDEKWLGFIMREVLENSESFAEAQKTLVTSKLLAPAYFILGGNTSDQACVITKDRDSDTADVWTVQETGEWFLVETNYDHWNKPPFFDDRRTPAQNCMRMKTQEVGSTFSGMFDVLSSKPNLNLLTVYTCLMNARKGQMETYLQRCTGSCTPW